MQPLPRRTAGIVLLATLLLLGTALVGSAQSEGGNSTAKCTAVRSGSQIDLISPAFVYRLDTADGLKGVAWQNRLTGTRISLGSGAEVEFNLDAADRRLFITGWKMASGQPGFVRPDEEGGYKQGCAAYDFDDSGWYTRTPPMSYGTPESPELSDYYWARTRVFLPNDSNEKDLSLVLGGFGLFEYRYMRVFVNGHEVGTRRYSTRWSEPGLFDLGPKSNVHRFLRFGQDNVIALQLAGYKCRTAKLNELDPRHQRDLSARYYWPGQFEQYLAVGKSFVSPKLRVTHVKIAPGGDECQVQVQLAAADRKITATMTYRWNSSEPVLHKFTEVQNNSASQVRLLNVRLGDFTTDLSVSEGEQGFPVYIDDQFFAALAHPAGWAIGQDGRVILRHYPGKILQSRESFSCMETVLGVGPAGGARRAFLAHLQSRMRRVVRKHDKPYAIFDPFGAWPNEDWWGGPASYMLDQIKNVIAPEVRESGCKFDFYCLELWRDIKGDIEHPNTKTYPKGFGRIRDELAKLGIGFALWNDVSGPLSWTCGENPKLWPDLTHDPTCPYQPELPWLCIAEEPLKGMFTGAFINHIRKNNLRLLKMDGNMSICYNPRHRHLPGVYSTEAIWNALADITRDLDRECPDLFIMLYWGCRSPWHLLYGDVSFDPGLALEAAHPSACPAPYIRDSIPVGLDQAQWFCDDTPKLGKDSLGVWLSRWGWNSGVGKERWQEGFIMDIARGSLLAQPWSDDGSLSKLERSQLADFIALLRERPDCFRNSRFILGNPWKNEPYGYCCSDGQRAFLAINNCTLSDQTLRLELNSAWGLPDAGRWDIYRWYPAPARLTADGPSFGSTAALGVRPSQVTLLEVVPAGSRPSLARDFASVPLVSRFAEPSRSLDVKVTPVSAASAPPKRTLRLNCQLPPSPGGGILMLAVEMRRGDLAVNLGNNGANFTASASISGTPVSCQTIITSISFPWPWQGWRIAVGPCDKPRSVESLITATIPADVTLICRGYFLPK
ncbi:MAG: hypothetical protein WCB27_01810 [Thermoguttaceae bacterium]